MFMYELIFFGVLVLAKEHYCVINFHLCVTFYCMENPTGNWADGTVRYTVFDNIKT